VRTGDGGSSPSCPQAPHIRNVHPGQGDVAGGDFVTLDGIYQPIRGGSETAAGARPAAGIGRARFTEPTSGTATVVFVTYNRRTLPLFCCLAR